MTDTNMHNCEQWLAALDADAILRSALDAYALDVGTFDQVTDRAAQVGVAYLDKVGRRTMGTLVEMAQAFDGWVQGELERRCLCATCRAIRMARS